MTRALSLMIVGLVLCAGAGCKDPTKAANEHNARGVALKNKGEYDQAIQEYDEAIRLRPNAGSLYNNRGLAYELKSDYTRAVQDFDEALRLTPNQQLAIKNRARAHFFLGEFAKSADGMRRGLDFDTAAANARPDHRLDGAGAYATIWYHLAMRRQGQSDSAEFAALAARADPKAWPGPVIGFYVGHLNADSLLASAAASGVDDTPDQRCAAQFYIGESALWAGRIDDAVRRFQATIAGCPKRFSEYHGAAAELAHMGR